MERFYFSIDYGEPSPDTEGTLLPDLKSARNAAVDLMGELLRDEGDKFWEKPNITFTVTEGTGLMLWTIEAVGVASPAVSAARR